MTARARSATCSWATCSVRRGRALLRRHSEVALSRSRRASRVARLDRLSATSLCLRSWARPRRTEQVAQEHVALLARAVIDVAHDERDGLLSVFVCLASGIP